MSVDSIIRKARTAYQGVMTTTVTVTRGTGSGTFNPATLSYHPSTQTTVYTGPCLMRPVGKPGHSTGQPEEMAAMLAYQYLIKFPANTPVQRGDAVTVTGSTYDSTLVGVTVWVADVDSDEWQTTQDAKCVNEIPEVQP